MTAAAQAGEAEDAVAHYRAHGYAVVRGVFGAGEVRAMAAAFERVYARALDHGRSYRHGNVFFRVAADASLGCVVRYVQWPSYFDPALDAVRRDPRLLAIVRPLIGDDVKQIINQMHWKPPGAASAEFGYHQDIRSRRPRDAYRDPANAYVQTGIAVDRHRAENGAMVVFPGSHRLGELALGDDASARDRPLDDADVVRIGLDPGAGVPLDLDPGDVAFWHLFTVHGSGPNRTDGDRRLYINGYVRAADCDRGAWTFRRGRPVPLGPPVPIHYEDLHARPEPHYVDD